MSIQKLDKGHDLPFYYPPPLCLLHMGIPMLIRTLSLSPFSLISFHNYAVLSLPTKKNNILQKELLCIRRAKNLWKNQLFNLYCLSFSPKKKHYHHSPFLSGSNSLRNSCNLITSPITKNSNLNSLQSHCSPVN